MLEQTLTTFHEQTGIEIHIPDDVTGALRTLCIADLSNGGRGHPQSARIEIHQPARPRPVRRRYTVRLPGRDHIDLYRSDKPAETES